MERSYFFSVAVGNKYMQERGCLGCWRGIGSTWREKQPNQGEEHPQLRLARVVRRSIKFRAWKAHLIREGKLAQGCDTNRTGTKTTPAKR